ncbi:MAG: diguanylate cyclase [Pseudomonadota bacterium]
MDRKLSVLRIKSALPEDEAARQTAPPDPSISPGGPANPDLQVASVRNLDEAMVFLQQTQVDAILMDQSDLPDQRVCDYHEGFLDQGDNADISCLCSFAASPPILVIAKDAGAEVAFQAIEAGADDVLLPTDLANADICRRIELAIARKATESHRLRYARKDRQTGLANTSLLEERFGRALARADRFATLVGLVAIDLDGFEGIVAGHGQKTADHLLTLVGQRLLGEARQTDTLARTRDHGFTWLVEGLSAINDISSLVSRLPDRLARPFLVRGRNLSITASVGVAIWPLHGSDFRTVHGKAEAAMIDVAAISGDALLMQPLPVLPAALT